MAVLVTGSLGFLRSALSVPASTFSAVGTMAIPLGMAATGLLVGAIGLHESLLVLGSLRVLLAAATSIVPAFRQMNVRAAMTTKPQELLESDAPVG